MGIFRPQKYIFMSIKLFTIFSIKCNEESHKINEWKFSCDTTTQKQAKISVNQRKITCKSPLNPTIEPR